MNSEIIEKAARLALERHEGQFRKGPARLPYVSHCEDVARLVARHGGDDIAVAAAWLHDAVEDTETTLGEISATFGEDVAGLVDEVTDDPNLEKHEARAAQIQDAGKKSPAAALIKAADQTSNMKSIVDTPPYWSREVALAYVDKARAVVAGLNATSSIKKEFEAEANAAEEKARSFEVADHYSSDRFRPLGRSR